jgi:hypothetical protein
VIEQRGGARHQVGMAIGDRIERAWIDSQTRIAQRFVHEFNNACE